MSNLLNESVCLVKKQNTIIGAFKRLTKPAMQQNPTGSGRMQEDIHAGMEGITTIDRTTGTAVCVEVGLSISDGDVAVHDDNIDMVDISEISKEYRSIPGDSVDNVDAINEISKYNEREDDKPFNNDTVDPTNIISWNNEGIADMPDDSADTADTITEISMDNGRVEEWKLASDKVDRFDDPSSGTDTIETAHAISIIGRETTEWTGDALDETPTNEPQLTKCANNTFSYKSINIDSDDERIGRDVIKDSEMEPGEQGLSNCKCEVINKNIISPDKNIDTNNMLGNGGGYIGNKLICDRDIDTKNGCSNGREKGLNIISMIRASDNVASAGVDVNLESTISQTASDSSILASNVKRTRSGLVRTPVSKVRRKSRRNSSCGTAKDQSQTYECPVCSQNVLCECLQSFNDHVDMCLENCAAEKHMYMIEKEHLVQSDSVNNGNLSKYQTKEVEELADYSGVSINIISKDTSEKMLVCTNLTYKEKIGSSGDVSGQTKADSESKGCIKSINVSDALSDANVNDYDVEKTNVTICGGNFECDDDCQTRVSTDLVESTNATGPITGNHKNHLIDDKCSEIKSIAAVHVCSSEIKCCKIPSNIDIESSAEMRRLDCIDSDNIGKDNVVHKNSEYGMIPEPRQVRDYSDNLQNIGDAIKYETRLNPKAETEEQVKQSPIVMLIDKAETANDNDFGKIQLETMTLPVSSNIIESNQKIVDCNDTHPELSTKQEDSIIDSNKVFASGSKQWNGDDLQTRALDMQNCIDGTDETENEYLEDTKGKITKYVWC